MYKLSQENITLSDEQPQNTLLHNFISNIFNMLGFEYESAMHKIQDLMNEKYGGWGCTNIRFAYCYQITDIELTINSYDNLVLDKQQPEYNLDKISLDTAKKIEQSVSYTSGIPLNKVHNIMTGLYYEFKDGLVKDILLFPESARRNEGYRLVPDSVKGTSGLEIADDMLKGLMDFGSFLFNVVLFGGIAIGGIYLIDTLNLKRN